MPARTRLLYLARDVPIPVSSAARLRTFNWVLHLSRRFDVTFVAGVRRAPDVSHLEALAPYCAELHVVGLEPRQRLARWHQRLRAEAHYLRCGVPPEASIQRSGELGALWSSLGARRDFGVVFAERWTWGAEALSLAPITALDALELQAPRHAELLRRSRAPWRRLLRRRLASGFAAAERDVLRRAGLLLARTGAERRALDAVCGEPRSVLSPPGLDTRYFAPRRGGLDPAKIVFFATLDSPAQRDALQHLQRDLLPQVRQRVRNAHVTVVAPRPVPELEAILAADPTTRFADPWQDARRELWGAAVAAVPLRFGSGSRDHLAQLLALGVPVVATPTAARGLDIVSGDGLLVAPDGPDFAAALVQVMVDSSLRDDLSRKGRETATAQLSMAATYERVSDLLASGRLRA